MPVYTNICLRILNQDPGRVPAICPSHGVEQAPELQPGRNGVRRGAGVRGEQAGGSVGRVGGDSIVLVDEDLLSVAGNGLFPGAHNPRRLDLRSLTGGKARGFDFR